ncbi:TEF transcription factor, PAR bZIP family member a isoform X1 [Amia ocellicauda]|uniref:TEF transcription factor, PAR bZIP family member a isoform X1 n=2 Tax=Amia ocellicauda TaxID=2972642 RepID=UPI0034644E08
MSGQSTVMEAAEELPSSIPVVLKKLMENPPPNLLEHCDSEKDDKAKLCGEDGSEEGGGGVSGSGGVGGGVVGSVGVSASLMPAIWDKTIPYDGETFHLEYMDLDEFLLENGIPASLEEELQRTLGKAGGGQEGEEGPVEVPKKKKMEEEEEEEKEGEESEGTSKGAVQEGGEGKSEASLPAATVTGVSMVTAGVTLLPAAELELSQEELVTATEDTADGPVLERLTPSPIDPEQIEVAVNFQPDPTDLVLSSVPGGELFDPRKHRFTDDDLKPQPMIKKAKKVFVPDEQKDDKYWSRRKKNNVAAKRSRDARRLKENQITVRAAFLERENSALRQEVAELRRDCGRCRSVVARYQAKYGPLANQEADVLDS